MPTARLSVNVDHVATIRQARRARYPDPAAAAAIAEKAGAAGITIHLRVDRRHIQDRDLETLRRTVRGKLNLEMAPSDEMLAIALEQRPDQVTLVPERLEEITTEGGLDLLSQGDRVARAAGPLTAAGISVSVFIDPDPRQVAWLAERHHGMVEGFEINTDRYCRAREPAERAAALGAVAEVADAGAASGLRVYAGHGLSTENVGPIAALRPVEELNIGHFIVARAVLVGMAGAVQEMLAAMTGGTD